MVPVERIARSILVIRGHKVMLDADLAVLYGVDTGSLNRAVKRNRERFPADFMFQLTAEELEAEGFGCGSAAGHSPSLAPSRLRLSRALRYQTGTSKIRLPRP